MCKKVFTKKNTSSTSQATILQRDQHPVSRKLMSNNALKVLYRLNSKGYDAYLVGGGVRDILLGITPKDFDIATNATPEQIKSLFKNCRLIGRRFRLAHIIFGRDIIEVATFRGHHDEDSSCQKTSKQSEHGMLLRDNIYGSIDEDAQRRDFTINAMYYSAKDFTVHDFANGIADIKNKEIRLIGDPETRYREDPVRMLRAIRFATKLSMKINAQTEQPIKTLAPLLANIPPARMFEEFSKLFLSGKATANFKMLRAYDLFRYLVPALNQQLDSPTASIYSTYAADFIVLAMDNTDQRINNEKGINPAFIYAAMLWYPLQEQISHVNAEQDLSVQDAFFAALGQIMGTQQQSITIPKRLQGVMKDIWILQDKLKRRQGKRAQTTFEHPKFRAGYDFLLMRAAIEEPNKDGPLTELAKWWTDYQDVSPETKTQMLKTASSHSNRTRRSPRKRRKPNSAASQGSGGDKATS